MNLHAPHRPLIVATPLGEESDAAVAAGLRLARLLERPALLLHADTPPPILLGAPGGGFVPDAALLDRQRDELAAALTAQARAVAPEGPAPECEVRIGPADLVLAAAADERDAELVVLGPPRRPELGTTADRLLRRLDRPVLVLRRPERIPPRRVLVAIDLSGPSEAALAAGLRLLRTLPGGPPSVELLFALHPQEMAASIHFTPDRVRAFAGEELQRLARRAVPEWAGVVDLCVRSGEARDVILEEAAARDADLVILGTHGRSGLERWLLGSVAAGVLRRAATNLLIVPRHGDAGDKEKRP